MNSFMIISCTNAIFNIISSYYAFCSIHFTSEEFCLNNVNYITKGVFKGGGGSGGSTPPHPKFSDFFEM